MQRTSRALPAENAVPNKQSWRIGASSSFRFNVKEQGSQGSRNFPCLSAVFVVALTLSAWVRVAWSRPNNPKVLTMSKQERIAKLKADAASWCADMKAFGYAIRAATAAGLPDVPDGAERASALNAREDAIYQEAIALGVMDADFMAAVHMKSTGPHGPNAKFFSGLNELTGAATQAYRAAARRRHRLASAK
jgi:hypothetical protein